MTFPIPNNDAGLQLSAQLVQQVANIGNVLTAISRHLSPHVDHMPVVAPSNEGDYMVFCHRCSMDSQSFVYPCQLPENAGVFPPRMLRVLAPVEGDDPLLAGRDAALQIARNGVMDTPSGSTESMRLKSIIEALTTPRN